MLPTGVSKTVDRSAEIFVMHGQMDGKFSLGRDRCYRPALAKLRIGQRNFFVMHGRMDGKLSTQECNICY